MSKSKYNTLWIHDVKPNNYDEVDHDMAWKRQEYNVPSLKTQLKNTCTVPTNNLTLDFKGRVFNCRCSGHVPFTMGYAHEFNTFEDIFNSPKCLEHQKSVSDKKFIYCVTQFCGIEGTEYQEQRPDGIYVTLEIDFSCNFTCPSCRTRMIFVTDPEMISGYEKVTDNLIKWIKSTEKKVYVELCGGEPFASIYYKNLIRQLIQYKNVVLMIRTNGSLLLKNADTIENHLDQIILCISIDAASKEVYETVRRGGNWENLLENLNYVKQLIDSNPNFYVSSNYTIQKNNLDDVIPYLEFSKQYGLLANYAVMEDWGVWIDQYEENCAHLPSSTVYEKFLNIVNDPIFLEYNVNVDNLKYWGNVKK